MTSRDTNVVLAAMIVASIIILTLFVHAYSGPRSTPSGDIGPEYQLTGTVADVTYQGTIAYADESYGPLYLAIPEPRGTVAMVCGPAGCVERTSTDVGPDLAMQRAGRIADVSSVDFETICGVPTGIGLCPGSVTISRRSQATLPPTDAE